MLIVVSLLSFFHSFFPTLSHTKVILITVIVPTGREGVGTDDLGTDGERNRLI